MIDDQLKNIAEQAKIDLQECRNQNDILNIRAKYLGKKSIVNSLYSQLRNLSEEERPAFGKKVNELRNELERMIEEKEEELKLQIVNAYDSVQVYDLTLDRKSVV